jgi:Domain of unknown function (DUF4123)
MTTDDDFYLAVRGTAPGRHLPPDLRHYLLIDHAGAPGLLAELRRAHGVSWWSLFADSKEQGAIDVAPILVYLSDDQSTLSERDFLRWVRRNCEFSTSAAVLHSAWAPDELIAALKRRLDVLLPDRMPVMLRYFDTRVLESLLQVLTSVQREQFMGVASRWHWLDRAGQLKGQDVEQLQADAWPHPFELDVAQQNALIDASAADALAEQMNTQAPDMCQSKSRAELHALAARCLTKFGKLHIEDLRTQTLYCLTALQLSSDFELQPGWAAALDSVTKKTISFEAALKEMGV